MAPHRPERRGSCADSLRPPNGILSGWPPRGGLIVASESRTSQVLGSWCARACPPSITTGHRFAL